MPDRVFVRDICFTGSEGKTLLTLASIGALVVGTGFVYVSYKIGCKVSEVTKNMSNKES